MSDKVLVEMAALAVVVILALIVTGRGYVFKVRSKSVEVEMRPGGADRE